MEVVYPSGVHDYPETTRSTETELMDSDAPPAELLIAEFRLLRWFNRVTDAAGSLVWTMKKRLGDAAFSRATVTEFGAGDAETARVFVSRARQQGWRGSYCVTDRSEQVIDLAKQAGTDGEFDFQIVDVLDAESVGHKSADVCFASLMLHHLGDQNVVRALRNMAAAARRLVVWNDLVRDRAGRIGARITTALSQHHVRLDAIRSVERSFTLDEAVSFAEAAGLGQITVRRWRGARFVLSAVPPADLSLGATVPLGQSGRQSGRPMIRAEQVNVSVANKGSSVQHMSHAQQDSHPQRSDLHSLSLAVRSGEIVLLDGPNGAEQSMLLQVLAGGMRPDSGRAWCDRVLGPIGYLPQPTEQTARQIARQTAGQRVGHKLGRPREIALASLFALEPGCLLLDEPTAGLDASGRTTLAGAIIQATERGAAVLLASRDCEWIESACREAGVALRRIVLP